MSRSQDAYYTYALPASLGPMAPGQTQAQVQAQAQAQGLVPVLTTPRTRSGEDLYEVYASGTLVAQLGLRHLLRVPRSALCRRLLQPPYRLETDYEPGVLRALLNFYRYGPETSAGPRSLSLPDQRLLLRYARALGLAEARRTVGGWLRGRASDLAATRDVLLYAHQRLGEAREPAARFFGQIAAVGAHLANREVQQTLGPSRSGGSRRRRRHNGREQKEDSGLQIRLRRNAALARRLRAHQPVRSDRRRSHPSRRTRSRRSRRSSSSSDTDSSFSHSSTDSDSRSSVPSLRQRQQRTSRRSSSGNSSGTSSSSSSTWSVSASNSGSHSRRHSSSSSSSLSSSSSSSSSSWDPSRDRHGHHGHHGRHGRHSHSGSHSGSNGSSSDGSSGSSSGSSGSDDESTSSMISRLGLRGSSSAVDASGGGGGGGGGSGPRQARSDQVQIEAATRELVMTAIGSALESGALPLPGSAASSSGSSLAGDAGRLILEVAGILGPVSGTGSGSGSGGGGSGSDGPVTRAASRRTESKRTTFRLTEDEDPALLPPPPLPPAPAVVPVPAIVVAPVPVVANSAPSLPAPALLPPPLAGPGDLPKT